MASGSLDQQIALLYDELKRLARSQMRRERADHTLSATALVNEAYLRLAGAGTVWESRAHFFGSAANAMRRVLVDHARAHDADKRGADWSRVTMTLSNDEIRSQVSAADEPMSVLDLDRALEHLGARDPRQAQIVELRYFGGFTIEQVADIMELSSATVKREWLVAKLFLRRALQS